MILPICAGLERIPTSLLEASADLGGRSLWTFLRVTLPLVFPAVVAGSIFAFSLTLGDYIAPDLITSQQFIGTVIYDQRGVDLPVAAAYTFVPIVVMTVYLLLARRLKAFEKGALGRWSESRFLRASCSGSVPAATLAFMYLPLVLVAVYAFNEEHHAALADRRFLDKVVRRGLPRSGRP